MDNKIDEILQKYPLNVTSRRRTRGALMLYTESGMYTIKLYNGSYKKLEFQKLVQDKLLSEGYQWIDEIILNNAGELASKDNRGNIWIVKRWHQGEECDIKDLNKVCLAAAHMARLHQMLVLDIDKDKICYDRNDLFDIFAKHNRELKRVHTYIKGKKQKNDMEIKLLNSYKMFYSQGEKAVELLKNSNYINLKEASIDKQYVLHGNYTYHNILFKDKQIITTELDKCMVGIQIIDLYGFLRKIMEKNSWQVDMGTKVLAAYNKVKKLSPEELHILYVLMLYPEKYWKLINFYYNNKKTWISSKNNEKLCKICEQESNRQEFLQELKSLSF